MRDFVAVMPLKGNALLDNPASFTKDVFALFRRKLHQKITKILILVVAPVELTPLTARKTIFGKDLKVLFCAKNTVHRRRFEFIGNDRERTRDVVADEHRLMVWMMKYSLPANGRERCRNEQFWIIRYAMALIGIGPGPIENELPV